MEYMGKRRLHQQNYERSYGRVSSRRAEVDLPEKHDPHEKYDMYSTVPQEKET